MTDYKLAGLAFTAPDDYRARMLVIAAPQKEGSKIPGQMVVKKESAFARNVVVATESVTAGTTAAQYAERQAAILKQSMQNFEVVKQGSLNIGGQECPMFEAQSSGPEGRLLSSLTAYLVKDNVAYTFSASHLAGLPYQETRAEYVKIIESFRLS